MIDADLLDEVVDVIDEVLDVGARRGRKLLVDGGEALLGLGALVVGELR